VNPIARQAKESGRALASAFRNPGIRRIELAWLAANMAEFALTVTLSVYAFNQGGAAAVGMLGIILYVPPIFFSPLVASLADRFSRKRVLVGGLLGRLCLSALMAAAMLAGWPQSVVYVLSAINMVFATTFWATQSAMIPSLARSPEEMSAANVASSLMESVGTLTGPLVAAVVMGVASTGWSLVVVCVIFALALVSVAGIQTTPQTTVAEDPPEDEEASGESFLRELLGGFSHLSKEREPRVVLLMNGLQNIAQAATGVLAVVLALSVFHIGDSGAGLLNAAIGTGGFAGSTGGVLLIGRRSLARPLGTTLLVAGAAMLAVAGVPLVWVTLIMFAVIGASLPICDISTMTLVQRLVPEQYLGRVFGILDGLLWTAWAVGAAVTGWLISLFGPRWTMVGLGMALPAYLALRWGVLRKIDATTDAPVAEIELLRGSPLFSPLSAYVVEELARKLERHTIATGEIVIRQGDLGDRYYIIESGRFDVTVDGEPVRTMGPGDSFGEIALLRDVPRTATVTAASAGSIVSLEREPFVDAVTGHSLSREAANAVIAMRLGPLH
jgi:MFS family permease